MEFGKAFIFALLLLLLAGASTAFSSTCIVGGSYTPGSGTCSGQPVQIGCSQIEPDVACCAHSPASAHCELVAGDCTDKPNTVPLSLPCSTFNGNAQVCDDVGCTWTPSAGGGGTLVVCQSFGESCGAGCCGGLICKNSKCVQKPDVCTIMPEVAPPLNPFTTVGGASPNGPLNVTNEQIQGTPSSTIQSSSGIYKTGWFSNWSAAGMVGVAIAIVIIALAAMAGHGFNLPEVKAFVDVELRQSLVSVLLIIGLLGFILFFDVIAGQLIATMNLPVAPNPNEPLYISAAKSYLNSTKDMASTYALDSLKESHKYQAIASLGVQGQMNFWFLLFAGSSIRTNAGMSMKAERAATIFETAVRLMASLQAQYYFIDIIAFGIAPMFLLFGIILRTFFFTRKLGGLMLAIAVSLFFVYPLTYAFAWYTLNITVYGERAFSTPDPSCPQECTARYPVAFFINQSSGEILQFDTTQKLMLSGINTQNWESGDVDNDGASEYPGLVACRNLSKAKINVDFTCKGCPDYCRDVPFPSSMPGCNIDACAPANCNPGCKIVRQRTDCEAACSVSSNCPLTCRTKQPMEGKCFFEDEVLGSSSVQPNDPSVSCSGCDTCPNWCRFLKRDSSGTLTRIYKDEPGCDMAACRLPTDNAGTCQKECFYITDLDSETNCETLCKADDGTVCPKFCRINNLSKTGPLAIYDTTDILSICTDPPIKAACSRCPAMCNVTLPVPPDPACAPYPKIGQTFTECSYCPEYCRFDPWDIFEPFSNTPLSGGIPTVCIADQATGKPACSPSGNPSECGAECKTNTIPLLCRDFNDNPNEPIEFCRQCPEFARVTLSHTLTTGVIETKAPNLINPTKSLCSGSNCSQDCKGTRTVPSQHVVGPNTVCKDFYTCGAPPLPSCMSGPQGKRDMGTAYFDGVAMFDAAEECSTCPTNCRVTGQGIEAYLNSSCATDCEFCPASCKADLGTSPPFSPTKCTEYIGNGPSGECSGVPSCVYYTRKDICMVSSCTWNSYYDCKMGNSVCADPSNTIDTRGECEDIGCNWLPKESEMLCFGPSGCSAYDLKSECVLHEDAGCIWTTPDDPAVPLSFRDSTYQDTSSCRQCPENCRLTDYAGNCGIGGLFPAVDCSLNSCEAVCRIPVLPSDTGTPPAPSCKPSGIGLPCEECSAFCRRLSDSPPEEKCFTDGDYCGEYDAVSGAGCSNDCRLPDAPNQLCEGCFECPLDCTFYPAIRTDCSEVCTDEALAGPVNIGPDDFVKKLPGAEGETDVKNIGTIMIPALVMPLFCIVIVIAFIRVFSPILGGDIEIPGLSRII